MSGYISAYSTCWNCLTELLPDSWAWPMGLGVVVTAMCIVWSQKPWVRLDLFQRVIITLDLYSLYCQMVQICILESNTSNHIVITCKLPRAETDQRTCAL